MFRSVLLSCIVASALGAIATSDLNCTQSVAGTPQWAPNAAVCSNVYDDATCQTIFADTAGTAQPPITPGTDQARATRCWGDGTTFRQDSKNLAIATCPKFCGYCCQTSAYSCTNAPYPRINCATVTNSMCNSVQWRTVIATDCPSTCGFCALGGCIDAAPDCSTNPTICVTRGLETFVAANCQRTCGLCSTTSTTITSVSSTCGNNVNCASWMRNGFCTSTFYTTAQRMSYCGVPCGLCSGK